MIVSLIGGLALFLYGMHTMGEGLSKVSGGKLEYILEKLTSTPIKGVVLGALVTAIIQSSSATTVMVVGFVNSGIMKLLQAVGVIMGANVGTTMTSWLLSLTSIESDNMIVQLFKPSYFAPFLALLGVILLMFAKKERRKDIGIILVGFSILMIGMGMMSDAVKPLANVPKFKELFLMFSHPLLGMLVGTVLTATIQSSSASIGILQALCMTGTVTYGSAIPIIMGQNLGTCITAMLASIGTNKNAKRAALIHLYFNIISITLFMISFYSINAFFPFQFLGYTTNPASIAVIHTLFNVTATALLLPFTKKLEQLTYMTIPEDIKMQEHTQIETLDTLLLDYPSFALERAKQVTIDMALLSRDALFETMTLFTVYDEKKVEKVITLEKKVDYYADELNNYLVKLSGKSLTEKDSYMLTTLLNLIGDFERISDHAMNIVEQVKGKHLIPSPQVKEEFKVYSKAIRDIVNTAWTVFEHQDKELALTIEPLEEVIDYLNKNLHKRHVKRLQEGTYTLELGLTLIDITSNLERVADHCSNIALAILQLYNEETFDAHEYIERLKHEDNGSFRESYKAYKVQYQLPK